MKDPPTARSARAVGASQKSEAVTIRICLIALALSVAGLASPARAAEPPEVDAGTLNSQGVQALKAGEWQVAVSRFQAAYALERSPRFVFNLGRAYHLWGLLEAAKTRYVAYLGLKKGSRKTRQRAKRFLDEIAIKLRLAENLAREAGALLTSSPAEAARKYGEAYRLTKSRTHLWRAAQAHEKAGDDAEAKRLYDEYRGHPRITSIQAAEASKRIQAIDDKNKPVEIAPVDRTPTDTIPDADVHKKRSPPPHDLRLPGWVTLGVGAAFLAGSLVLHLEAEANRDLVAKAKVGAVDGVATSMSQTRAMDLQSGANTLDNWAIVGLAAGGAAVVTGIILLVVDWPNDDEPIVMPAVGNGRVMVRTRLAF